MPPAFTYPAAAAILDLVLQSPSLQKSELVLSTMRVFRLYLGITIDSNTAATSSILLILV